MCLKDIFSLKLLYLVSAESDRRSSLTIHKAQCCRVWSHPLVVFYFNFLASPRTGRDFFYWYSWNDSKKRSYTSSAVIFSLTWHYGGVSRIFQRRSCLTIICILGDSSAEAFSTFCYFLSFPQIKIVYTHKYRHRHTKLNWFHEDTSTRKGSFWIAILLIFTWLCLFIHDQCDANIQA